MSKLTVGDKVTIIDPQDYMPQDVGTVTHVYGSMTCDVYFESIGRSMRFLLEELEPAAKFSPFNLFHSYSDLWESKGDAEHEPKECTMFHFLYVLIQVALFITIGFGVATAITFWFWLFTH